MSSPRKFSSRPTTPSLIRRPASSLSVRSNTPSSMLRLNHMSSLTNIQASASTYTGTIKVSIRVKPETAKESNWWVDSTRGIISSREVGEFMFDHVLPASGTNRDLFTTSVKPLVSQVLEGYNSTVFAYGMTGSGKTYSMQGIQSDPGIVPQTVNYIYDTLGTRTDTNFTVTLSYLEIYNEHFQDLLNPHTPPDDIKLRADKNTIKVVGLREVNCPTAQQLFDSVMVGDSLRKTEGTEFNSRSSRSHAIIHMNIVQTKKANPTQAIQSSLYLCDLAGSERAVSQTDRRREGSYINKSLLTLGTVIARLSSATTTSLSSHIPYRDSKLTRLLQPALSGSALVSVICTVLPSGGMETISTLRFAARAKNVVIQAKRNELDLSTGGGSNAALEAKLLIQEKELDRLRALVQQPSTSTSGQPSFYVAQLEAENKILHERVEHLTRLCDDSRIEEVIGLGMDDGTASVISEKSSGTTTTMNTAATSPIAEYKSYIEHLEKQIVRLEVSRSMSSVNEVTPKPQAASHLQDIIKELKEEIIELKESNRDKDRMIEAFRAISKQKENISSNSQAYARYYQNNQSVLAEQDLNAPTN